MTTTTDVRRHGLPFVVMACHSFYNAGELVQISTST